MAVHLTRIYTRTGDGGQTRLGNNELVAKTDPRIAAYADADECNAALGVALALGDLPEDVRAVLTTVQNDLFDVGADLCNPAAADPPYPPLRITEAYVTRLEGWCDEFNERLAAAGQLRAARRHARGGAAARGPHGRAAGGARRLGAARPSTRDRTGELPAKYLNRLTDLLFILSRVANPSGDVKWVPGGGSAV